MIARLAWRSLWRRPQRTVVTVVSIGLGLAFVVFFVTLAEGIYAQLIDDAVRMQGGHLTVEHEKYREAPAVDLWVADAAALGARIGRLAEVERTKLLALGQGIARSGSGAVGVAVMGVEPAAETESSPLARRLVSGAYLDGGDDARVIIGRELAERLKLGVGKKVVVASNDASGALVETLFRVKGIFETGADEVDGYLIQAPLGAIRRFYGLPDGAATQLAVILRNPDDEGLVLGRIRAMVRGQPLAVSPWQEVLPALSAFIRLDRTSDYTFQGMLLVLVLFTIFNSLLMAVLEREKENAILLALGTPPRQLRLQVLLESAYIGSLGCALGLALGGAVASVIQVYGWDLSSLYPSGFTVSGLALSTRVHARVTAGVLLWLGALVLGVTLLLGMFAARRAARVGMVDLLR